MQNVQDWITWIGVGIGAVIATIITRLGFASATQKKETPESSITKQFEIAGAIVDSGAINRLTAAVEAFNMSVMQGAVVLKEYVEKLEYGAKVLDDMKEELARLREEIRINREISNSRFRDMKQSSD